MSEISTRSTAPEDRAQSEPAPPDPLAILLSRVAAGEQGALAELYERTVTKLFGLASIMTGNAPDAEEVVCDAFVQVWRTASQYDAVRGSALGWLLMICRSRALDRRRRDRCGTALYSRMVSASSDDRCEPAADDLLQIFERDSAIFHAVAGLSPLRRRLIALAFFQGLTHQEIAVQTQLPMGTVKSHIRRALATIRSALESRGDGARPE